MNSLSDKLNSKLRNSSQTQGTIQKVQDVTDSKSYLIKLDKS
jgi:hypothetical protein